MQGRRTADAATEFRAAAPGGDGDGDGGAHTQRFVVCHNPDQAQRDAQVRENLGQKAILTALELPEPPKYLEFTAAI